MAGVHNYETRLLKRGSPDKRKAAAFTREAIPGNINVANLAASLEHAPQIFRRRPIREIVDFQGNHPVDAGRWPTVTHSSLSNVTSPVLVVRCVRLRGIFVDSCNDQ